jgi:hypothetical protein
MSHQYKVDFATFCHKGDVHRLHAPGQLKRQVESNRYLFDEVIIVCQYGEGEIEQTVTLPYFDQDVRCKKLSTYYVCDIDNMLRHFNIDLNKPQYKSKTDQAHTWKNHVVNHLAAIGQSSADYIVFADNDCWMVRQPEHVSWIERGIEILQAMPEIFIVSPNDGEPERHTRRFSQQMFLARVDEFRNADFNQPGWDGNVDIPGGPMPEYWAMLEGRMELYCRATGQWRYVLGPEYRYWHFNKINKDGFFETDLSKY